MIGFIVRGKGCTWQESRGKRSAGLLQGHEEGKEPYLNKNFFKRGEEKLLFDTYLLFDALYTKSHLILTSSMRQVIAFISQKRKLKTH